MLSASTLVLVSCYVVFSYCAAHWRALFVNFVFSSFFLSFRPSLKGKGRRLALLSWSFTTYFAHIAPPLGEIFFADFILFVLPFPLVW